MREQNNKTLSTHVYIGPTCFPFDKRVHTLYPLPEEVALKSCTK